MNLKNIQKTNKLQNSLKKNTFYFILLLWPLIHFLVFYLYVNLNSILLAFRSYDFDKKQFVGFGLDNIKKAFEFFTLPYFKYSIKNSCVAFGVSFFIGTPLGLLFAFYIYKKMLFHNFFKFLLFLPSIIPSVAMVLIFMYFTEEAYPDLANLLFNTQVEGLLQNPNTAFATVIFYTLWAGFGTSVVMYASAMSTINESVVEAAKLDGAGPLREFISITFPSVYSTFSTFLVVSVAGFVTNQLNLYTFFSTNAEPKFYTIGYYLFREINVSGKLQYPYLSALGIVLTICVAPLTFLVKYLVNRFGYGED